MRLADELNVPQGNARNALDAAGGDQNLAKEFLKMEMN